MRSESKVSIDSQNGFNSSEANRNFFTKSRILKNAFVLSSGFILLFTANDALTMLQSTINREQGIGVDTQAIIFACFCVSALLLPKYVIKKIGCKATLVFSMASYVPILAANFYPRWALMVPCAILSGIGASLLWGSQCTFLNEIAAIYAEHLVPVVDLKQNDRKAKINAFPTENVNSNRPKKSVSRSISDNQAAETESKPDGKKFNSGGIEKNCLQSNWNTFSKTKQKTEENGTNGDTAKHTEKQFAKTYKVHQLDPSSLTEIQDTKSISENSNLPKLIESTTARFFGCHGMAYLSTHIWSNLMSYYVLQKDHNQHSSAGNFSCTCGADFCNEESLCFIQNLGDPSNEVRYILTGACVALSVCSVILVAAFMDPLRTDKKHVSFSLDLLMATFNLARKKKKVLLLIPMSFYIGMMHGFYIGDYTKSYIGCAWGTHHIGLVSVCYGAMCAISSLLSGWLVKRLGRLPILIFAAIVNLADVLLLLLWHPHPNEPALFFIASGLFGFSTGIFWSQIRAFYGILFKADEEAAFATYHLWQSLGTCVSFSYSNYLCTSVKVYLLLVVSTVAIFGYLAVELCRFFRRE
ncbi:protein unc-93 homolog A-like [Uloborus diversus]|uniref:protein unc-93 homolog A-like n=1 Tax=Uloborus diversus TaxID=327109 RepID=UPI002409DE5E|nr:protein unc-93 homolog A-like [Uloborus diversus]